MIAFGDAILRTTLTIPIVCRFKVRPGNAYRSTTPPRDHSGDVAGRFVAGPHLLARGRGEIRPTLIVDMTLYQRSCGCAHGDGVRREIRIARLALGVGAVEYVEDVGGRRVAREEGTHAKPEVPPATVVHPRLQLANVVMPLRAGGPELSEP